MLLSDLLNKADILLTPLKILAIVLTGIFGGIGLLTDFRDKRTKKITPWGRASLIGIILSTAVGVVTHWLDSVDTEKQTRTTLLQLQRGLSSLDGMELHLRFAVPCESSDFHAFCDGVRHVGQDVANLNNFQQFWDLLPAGGKFPIAYTVHFFAEPAEAHDYLSAGTEGDLRVYAFISDNDWRRDSSVSVDDKKQIIIHTRFSPVGFNNLYSRGKMFGKPDLSEAAVLIQPLTTDGKLLLLEPDSLGIIMKDGEQIYTPDHAFRGFTTDKNVRYYCGFMPRQTGAGDPKKSSFVCPTS
jgi:hypothetical protein